jgi:uncharacterized repeat protein (TIGR01451 family)
MRKFLLPLLLIVFASLVMKGAAPTPTPTLTSTDTPPPTPTPTPTPATDLLVTVTDGKTAAVAGTKDIYTIVVTNAGPADVTGAAVSDSFPASFTGVTFTATQSGGASGFTATGTSNISDTLTMPSGSFVTYKATGKLSSSATGTLSNTATVTAPNGVTDSNPANNSATDTDTIKFRADLKVTVTDGKTAVIPGATNAYTIVLSNSGPSDVTGAVISDGFPAGFTGVTFTATQSGGALGFTGSGSGNINDTVTMPSGSKITYKTKGTISSSAIGTLSDTASVTVPSGVTDRNLANNSASDTDTIIVAPSITSQPVNEMVTAEWTATFAVKATGATPLSYQWQENGVDIVGATKSSYTTPAITEVDDGAVFAVTVSNSAGSVTSNNVTLTVNPAPSPTPTITPTPPPMLPPVNHVFVIMEENHSYSEIIGSRAMPYLQSLADQYGLATNYYANTHPSIGNYFMLTTGQIITNDDKYTSTVFDDNIVRHLRANGKTWREYTENLPYAGYVGADGGGYDQHHNPLSYFSDVRSSTEQLQNLVPFTQLAVDMAAGQLPNYGFIVPTDAHNGHEGTSLAADQWLQTNIGPLTNDPQFQTDGLLLIIFDEGRGTDTANGGGQVVWVAVGPSVQTGYTSSILYQHQNTLKTVCDLLGIGSFSAPSLATHTLPSMVEFITPMSSPTPAPAPTPTDTLSPSPTETRSQVLPRLQARP